MITRSIVYASTLDPSLHQRRGVADTTLSFGVSGILRNSALVMYDRSTYSLWTQEGVAIAGPLTGLRLKRLPSQRTTWADWRRQYPQTLVLAPPPPGDGRGD